MKANRTVSHCYRPPYDQFPLIIKIQFGDNSFWIIHVLILGKNVWTDISRECYVVSIVHRRTNSFFLTTSIVERGEENSWTVYPLLKSELLKDDDNIGDYDNNWLR
jgi:hypothetical protein